MTKAGKVLPPNVWVGVGGSALYKGGKLRLQSANPGCTPEKLQISKYFIFGNEISKPRCESHPKKHPSLIFVVENKKHGVCFVTLGIL